MEDITIKLAVIYDEFNGKKDVFLDTIALVRFYNETEYFEVISGKYLNKTSFFFNEITVSEDNILSYPNEIKQITDYEGRKNIYFFDQDFFKSRINMFDKSIKTLMLDLLLKLNNIYIHINNDNSIFSIFKENPKIPDTNDIFNVEYGNIDSYADEVFKTAKVDKELKEFFKSLDPIFLTPLIPNISDQYGFSESTPTMDIMGILPVATKSNPLFERIKENVEKEPEKEPEKDKTYNNQIVNEMINSISNKIVGQEEAIKTLVSNIYFNQVLIDHLEKEKKIDPSRLDSSKVAILLDGETGTGKTAIEKEIARMLDLPIVITNANSFSETGYVGPTITDILEKLVDQVDGNISKAERGIIVLDEIDKVATKDDIYGKDMDKGVQEELLSFIGGGEYDIRLNDGLFGKSARFDTSKLTFILSGAFTDLREEKIKEEEKKYNGMGFGVNTSTNNKKSYTVSPEDYINYGLMREFFGRIKVLTSTKSYKFEDYKRILLTSEVSPLKNFEKSVKMFGYEGISYNEEFVDRLATEAVEMKTGARALQTIMSGIQNKLLLGLINHEFSEDIIELSTSLIDDYKKANIREY